MLIVNQAVSPIVVGQLDTGDGRYSINGNVLGTCFSLSGGFFLTAGHVVRDLEARPSGWSGLVGFAVDQMWQVAEVSDSEVLDADVGLVKCSSASPILEKLPTLSWNLDNLGVLATVRAIGYAYGLHTVDEEFSIVARAFKGNVACTLPRFKPLGYVGTPFSAHELSFAAPRGLSGAPLLTEFDPPLVKGVVIGNSQSTMRILSETEKQSEADSSRTTEVYESMSLGVAVRAVEVAALGSRLLERTIRDHLKDHDLLA